MQAHAFLVACGQCLFSVVTQMRPKILLRNAAFRNLYELASTPSTLLRFPSSTFRLCLAKSLLVHLLLSWLGTCEKEQLWEQRTGHMVAFLGRFVGPLLTLLPQLQGQQGALQGQQGQQGFPGTQHPLDAQRTAGSRVALITAMRAQILLIYQVLLVLIYFLSQSSILPNRLFSSHFPPYFFRSYVCEMRVRNGMNHSALLTEDSAYIMRIPHPLLRISHCLSRRCGRKCNLK